MAVLLFCETNCVWGRRGGAESLVAGLFTVERGCPLGLCAQRNVKIKERNLCDWEG